MNSLQRAAFDEDDDIDSAECPVEAELLKPIGADCAHEMATVTHLG